MVFEHPRLPELLTRHADLCNAGTDAQTELLWPTGTPKGDSRPASPFEVNTELSLSPSVNPRSTHASEDGAGAEGQGDENKRRQQRQQQQIQQQQQRQQQQRRQHLLQQQDPNPEAPAIEFQGFPTGSLQGTAQPDVVRPLKELCLREGVGDRLSQVGVRLSRVMRCTTV
eukprot:119430-Pelagomonas_calceolata.AAC.1